MTKRLSQAELISLFHPFDMARAGLQLDDILVVQERRANSEIAEPAVCCVRVKPSELISKGEFYVEPSVYTALGHAPEGSLLMATSISLTKIQVHHAKIVSLRVCDKPDLMVSEGKRITFIRQSFINVFVMKNNVFRIMHHGEPFMCLVQQVSGHTSSDPHQSAYIITESTRFEYTQSKVRNSSVFFDDLPFITAESSELKMKYTQALRLTSLHLMNCMLHSKFSNITMTGILLTGLSGSGKSSMAKCIARRIRENNKNVFIHVVKWETLCTSNVKSSSFHPERNLHDLFEIACQNEMSIIILDDIDKIVRKRNEIDHNASDRLLACLLSYMDGFRGKSIKNKCFFIGTASNVQHVDPALRRPGRFDREIELNPPSVQDRYAILNYLFSYSDLRFSGRRKTLQKISEDAHGFLPVDLLRLYMRSLQIAQNNMNRTLTSNSISKTLEIFPLDVYNAMLRIKPRSLLKNDIEIPSIRWSHIGGQLNAKRALLESLEWPMSHPQVFKNLGVGFPKGVMMFGPPGCSKTMMAKAISTECKMNFISVKGPELLSKYVGDSEKAISDLFRRARAASPSIIFFDEIDSLAVQRGKAGDALAVNERVLSQLLTEIDGLDPVENVVTISATNRPDLVDKALLRPGRTDRILYIGLPDNKERSQVFKLHCLASLSNSFEHILAYLTLGYTGAEIAAICRESGLEALKNASLHPHSHELLNVLPAIRPRTSICTLKFYDNYRMLNLSQ